MPYPTELQIEESRLRMQDAFEAGRPGNECRALARTWITGVLASHGIVTEPGCIHPIAFELMNATKGLGILVDETWTSQPQKDGM